MTDKQLEKDVVDYVSGSKWAIIATVKDGKVPVLRTIGGFANEGLNVYFSTGKETEKVKQISKNQNVAIFFQHEGQERAKFRSVTITGEAKLLSENNGLAKAVAVLGNKNPKFKEKIENGGLDKTAVYQIEPKTIKSLDFSKGSGPAAVQTFSV
jgi:nitroimidazol reductase NimA-like FMN-containing flavoprotein (pyridoxamine 5'-phosphate oxidase superfamily)